MCLVSEACHLFEKQTSGHGFANVRVIQSKDGSSLPAGMHLHHRHDGLDNVWDSCQGQAECLALRFCRLVSVFFFRLFLSLFWRKKSPESGHVSPCSIFTKKIIRK